ncbi:hypothetical protein CBR_g12032 [Chara braunii]|uniref:Myb-like domain-containing protein n=1 Tax=Chara braunii TaxID=69332 RepID=A0A388KR27_CHABU|nr:hypothetical protein CBR_g12032 [Chara braunii]|eukprot:GBG72458.1 hypothetical protein CBR_g12032 [Chara braunii]
MADVFRRLPLLVLAVVLLLLLVVFHVCILDAVPRRGRRRRSSKKDVGMEGRQGMCRSAGDQGGGHRAGQSPARSSRSSEQSGYAHMPPHLQPLPDTSDEEEEDRRSRTVPLGSGSIQDWAAIELCGSRDGGYDQSYTELLQQGLSDDEGDGGVNLSFGLCSGKSSAASRTVIVNNHPDDEGRQLTAVARSSKSPASIREASGNNGDPPRQQFRTPCRKNDGDAPAVGADNQEWNDDDGEGGEDDAGHVPPLKQSSMGGRGGKTRACARNGNRGKKAAGNGSDAEADGDAEGGRQFWSVDNMIALNRAKLDQDAHLQGMGIAYARMKLREWKWLDVEQRLKKVGVDTEAERCGKKWDNLMQQFKKVHHFQGLSGKQDFFQFSGKERLSKGFNFNMDRAVYDEILGSTVKSHTINPKNVADIGAPSGVHLPFATSADPEFVGDGDAAVGHDDDEDGSTRGHSTSVLAILAFAAFIVFVAAFIAFLSILAAFIAFLAILAFVAFIAFLAASIAFLAILAAFIAFLAAFIAFLAILAAFIAFLAILAAFIAFLAIFAPVAILPVVTSISPVALPSRHVAATSVLGHVNFIASLFDRGVLTSVSSSPTPSSPPSPRSQSIPPSPLSCSSPIRAIVQNVFQAVNDSDDIIATPVIAAETTITICCRTLFTVDAEIFSWRLAYLEVGVSRVLSSRGSGRAKSARKLAVEAAIRERKGRHVANKQRKLVQGASPLPKFVEDDEWVASQVESDFLEEEEVSLKRKSARRGSGALRIDDVGERRGGGGRAMMEDVIDINAAAASGRGGGSRRPTTSRGSGTCERSPGSARGCRLRANTSNPEGDDLYRHWRQRASRQSGEQEPLSCAGAARGCIRGGCGARAGGAAAGGALHAPEGARAAGAAAAGASQAAEGARAGGARAGRVPQAGEGARAGDVAAQGEDDEALVNRVRQQNARDGIEALSKVWVDDIRVWNETKGNAIVKLM